MPRRVSAVFCLLSSVVCILTAACSRREAPADAAITTRTLLVGNLAEPQELDPQLIAAYTDQNIAVALFEGLCAIDERTSQPVPGAAEKWEVSGDGLTENLPVIVRASTLPPS